ncbi:MAG: helix-turn-helix domain-containing protein [Ruminococcus sp.]|nr:helix-turn-helix domain-containing protein [Ruminococcus sp.]
MNEDLFREYGDIVSVDDVMTMLHLGRNKVYELLRQGTLKTVRIGKKYIIPKKSVIDFISAI